MNRGHLKYIIMTYFFIPVMAEAKIPEWAARNSTKLNGSVLTTVCHGTGPSLDIARTAALQSCQSNASQFLRSKIKIKSLSVETEKSVGFHQEITNSDEIYGLSCDPQRDQTDESDSHFTIWLECKFDLKKASSKAVEQENETPDNSSLNTLESSKINSDQDFQNKNIFVSSVPKCESIIIKGIRSRTIPCVQNPLKIQIKNGDEELLIRAKGYKPKTIKVKGANANDTIQVLLDLL